MSVSDNYSPTRDLGDGTTTEYTASWPVFDEDYLVVIFEDVTTGEQTVQTSGFTVSFDASTVTVTFSTAPTSDYHVILARSIDIEQQTPYRTSRGFQGAAIENSLDVLTAICQDLRDDIDRSLKTPIGGDVTEVTMPSPSDGSFPYWDGTDGTMANSPLTITAIQDAIDSLDTIVSGSGVLVSSNDTTVGYLDGKLLAGTGVTLTVGNEGGNETLTIASTSAAFTSSDITGQTEEVISSSDYLVFSDTSDSGNLKKDTVQGIVDIAQNISSLTSVTPATDDEIIINDTSDSGNPKKVTVSALSSLVGGRRVIDQYTITSDTSVDYSGLFETGKNYIFILDEITWTGGDSSALFRLEKSAAFLSSTVYDQAIEALYGDGTQNTFNNTSQTSGLIGNSDDYVSAEVKIYSPYDNDYCKTYIQSTGSRSATSGDNFYRGYMTMNTTGVFTGIQFFVGTRTMNGGIITVIEEVIS